MFPALAAALLGVNMVRGGDKDRVRAFIGNQTFVRIEKGASVIFGEGSRAAAAGHTDKVSIVDELGHDFGVSPAHEAGTEDGDS
jgi:hypothetical protein